MSKRVSNSRGKRTNHAGFRQRLHLNNKGSKKNRKIKGAIAESIGKALQRLWSKSQIIEKQAE